MLHTSIAQSTPPDIIREIFKPFATRLELRFGRTHEFPWYLGHVCSTWRTVFVSMRDEFWSKLRFNLVRGGLTRRLSGIYLRESCKDILKLFLERGSGGPISFIVQGGQLEPLSSSVLELLMTEPERWLDVSYRADECKLSTLLSMQHQLPLLRSLELSIPYPQGLIPKRHPDCQNVVKIAPHLTRLRISSILWTFNWSSLTVFELTYGRLHEAVLEALGQMVNLEKLLVEQPDVEDEVDNGTVVTLPRLKLLATVGYMVQLLSVLRVPVLEELFIDLLAGRTLWEESVDSPFDVCTTFFQRTSHHQLTHVGIRTCDSDFVLHVLQYTPRIKLLSVHVSYETREDIYAYLTFPQRHLVPEMQQLRVHCRKAPELDSQCKASTWLKDMVNSRITDIDEPKFRELVFIFYASYTYASPDIGLELNGGIRLITEQFDPDFDWASSFLRGDTELGSPN